MAIFNSYVTNYQKVWYVCVCIYIFFFRGFQKWWYPNSWMVYHGKSDGHGIFRGTPILGQLHLSIVNGV